MTLLLVKIAGIYYLTSLEEIEIYKFSDNNVCGTCNMKEFTSHLKKLHILELINKPDEKMSSEG